MIDSETDAIEASPQIFPFNLDHAPSGQAPGADGLMDRLNTSYPWNISTEIQFPLPAEPRWFDDDDDDDDIVIIF